VEGQFGLFSALIPIVIGNTIPKREADSSPATVISQQSTDPRCHMDAAIIGRYLGCGMPKPGVRYSYEKEKMACIKFFYSVSMHTK
jgi:hypothetical protein